MSNKTIILKKGNRVFFGQYDWGNYCLLLFYASKLDAEKVKTLLRLIFGESAYEDTYELPVTNPDEDTQFIDIKYNASLISEAVSFLKDEVIPALENESAKDLVEKYGGKETLELAINTGEEMVTDLIGVSDEYYSEDTETFIGFCTAIQRFFEEVLSEGLDYKTEID